MRATLRLLANVKPGRYLEPGAPTGLTGLYTHSSPRSALLYLYTSTLDKLGRTVPESSLYRQSVEAVTRHRLAIVESEKPAGYDEWQAAALKTLEAHPDEFNVVSAARVDGARAFRVERGGLAFVIRQEPPERDERQVEWDGEIDEGPELEGIRTEEERASQALLAERRPLEEIEQTKWEPEPQLTADQISVLETKIGAGLIEEVIQVAESELNLIDTMTKAKVWENLEEQPVEGQWKYFERTP